MAIGVWRSDKRRTYEGHTLGRLDDDYCTLLCSGPPEDKEELEEDLLAFAARHAYRLAEGFVYETRRDGLTVRAIILDHDGIPRCYPHGGWWKKREGT